MYSKNKQVSAIFKKVLWAQCEKCVQSATV